MGNLVRDICYSIIQRFDQLTDTKRLMTNKDDPKCKVLSMIRIIRKMFLDSPDKSQMTLKGECQTCKRPLTIDIVHTPKGFGVMGGVLTDLTTDRHYRLLCPVCHTNSKQFQTTDNPG